MDVLRDPIWQFVGVVVAVLTATIPIWMVIRKRLSDNTRNEEIIAEMKKHLTLGVHARGKHKKRLKDTILLANVTMDFLNQFPMPIGVLAAHLDSTYTPENFGASDWLSVFRRLSAEGYFIPVGQRSAKRLQVESLLNAGPKLESFLRQSVWLHREVAGLDDELG